MNKETDELWDEEQIEAWRHDQWLLMQELGDDYYKMDVIWNEDLVNRHDHYSEEDPFEEEKRMRLQQEEWEAKA